MTDAWCSAQMYRGLEGILEGRDARDAWLLAQRICGNCGSAHALASVSAVENALGVTVPPNARLLRNILVASKSVVDHVVQFYLRHALDWVDPTAALEADPTAASTLARSLSDRPNTTPADLKTARDRLSALIGTSQAGPLANGYWRHAAYTLAPEPSLMVLAHYLEALDWQREMVKLHVLLGGKSPHPQTFVLGGMALTPPWGGPKRPDTGQHPWQSNRNTPSPLSDEGLAEIRALIKTAQGFVTDVYLPDVLTIAENYRDWTDIGQGIGHYLSFGAYPEDGTDEPALLLPRGRVMDRDVSRVVAVDQTGVAETVAHSYYLDEGNGALVRPPDEQTDPAYAGPKPPFTTLEGFDRYSWSKAPRYEDDPMEVGPAARMLVAYASGVTDVKTAVDQHRQPPRRDPGGARQHARSHRRAGGRGEVRGDPAHGLARCARGQPRDRRHRGRRRDEVGPGNLAGGGAGLVARRDAGRRGRALAAHRRRPDRAATRSWTGPRGTAHRGTSGDGPAPSSTPSSGRR